MLPCVISLKWVMSKIVGTNVLAFIQALNGKLLKTKDKSTRRDIQRELRSLSKEERKRQQLAVSDVIKNADVVLTTLTGALSHKLDSTSFDLVIIDEAAQALEIACWIALLKVNMYSSCKPPEFYQHKFSFGGWLLVIGVLHRFYTHSWATRNLHCKCTDPVDRDENPFLICGWNKFSHPT